MSNFSGLFVVGLLVFAGAAFLFFRVIQARLNRPKLDACDYAVFEALPAHLPGMRADLEENGWRLTRSEPALAPAMLYTFEKASPGALSLSQVFAFEKSMPRTAGRTISADFPIKIRAHGSSRTLAGG